jgi:hypothetical protein
MALLGAVSLGAAPAPATAASASLMVVGRDDALLQPAKRVELRKRTARVSGRRCAVGARTPMSVLLGAKLKLRLRDYGACGSDPADASGLYVVAVNGQKERGRGGWVYKLGRKAPATGAADRTRRTRAGARVLWFWCEQSSSGSCQRTLEASPERRSAKAGEALRVTVRGYDDNGRGMRIEGATVKLGGSSAVTGADGVATVTVPAGGGALTAEKAGLVRSFPVPVSAP